MFHQSCMTLAYGLVEHKLLIWHRRLDQPFLGYLESLLPFLNSSKLGFICEACILAKNHNMFILLV